MARAFRQASLDHVQRPDMNAQLVLTRIRIDVDAPTDSAATSKTKAAATALTLQANSSHDLQF